MRLAVDDDGCWRPVPHVLAVNAYDVRPLTVAEQELAREMLAELPADELGAAPTIAHCIRLALQASGVRTSEDLEIAAIVRADAEHAKWSLERGDPSHVARDYVVCATEDVAYYLPTGGEVAPEDVDGVLVPLAIDDGDEDGECVAA